MPFNEALEALHQGQAIKTMCDRRILIKLEGEQPVDALRCYVFWTEEDYNCNNWEVVK